MRKILAAAVMAALPAVTLADGMSYSYIEGGLVRADIDGAGDGTGFLIGGSFGFANVLFGFAEFQQVDIDTSFGDFEVEAGIVGLGGRLALSDNSDVTMRIGAIRADAAFGGFSVDDNGYLLGVGLRGRPSSVIELEGGIEYVDIGDSGGDTSIKLDGRYYFTSNFSLGLGGTFADDETDFRVLARYTF